MVSGFLENYPGQVKDIDISFGVFPSKFAAKSRILNHWNSKPFHLPHNNELQSHLDEKLRDASVLLQLYFFSTFCQPRDESFHARRKSHLQHSRFARTHPAPIRVFLFRHQVMWSKGWRGSQVYLVLRKERRRLKFHHIYVIANIVWWIWGGRNTIAKQLDCYCIPMPKKYLPHVLTSHQSCPSWFFIPTNTTFLRSISEVAIPKDNIREGIFAITLADMFHWFNGERREGIWAINLKDSKTKFSVISVC